MKTEVNITQSRGRRSCYDGIIHRLSTGSRSLLLPINRKTPLTRNVERGYPNTAMALTRPSNQISELSNSTCHNTAIIDSTYIRLKGIINSIVGKTPDSMEFNCARSSEKQSKVAREIGPYRELTAGRLELTWAPLVLDRLLTIKERAVNMTKLTGNIDD
jgi:hypothetical protein